VFSSVAGDRGRTSVVMYGAAKAGLSAYLEGLDHRFRSQGLVTVCVKPGFVRTGMTSGLKEPPFAGEPDDVSETVIRAIDQGTPVVYAPAVWKAVMTAIKAMPRFVMRRVKF
jgi:short-subunit dehydrogenase